MNSITRAEEWIRKVFTEARTHSHWQNKPVEDRLLEEIYALAKMGPTSAIFNPLHHFPGCRFE